MEKPVRTNCLMNLINASNEQPSLTYAGRFNLFHPEFTEKPGEYNPDLTLTVADDYFVLMMSYILNVSPYEAKYAIANDHRLYHTSNKDINDLFEILFEVYAFNERTANIFKFLDNAGWYSFVYKAPKFDEERADRLLKMVLDLGRKYRKDKCVSELTKLLGERILTFGKVWMVCTETAFHRLISDAIHNTKKNNKELINLYEIHESVVKAYSHYPAFSKENRILGDELIHISSVIRSYL